MINGFYNLWKIVKHDFVNVLIIHFIQYGRVITLAVLSLLFLTLIYDGIKHFSIVNSLKRWGESFLAAILISNFGEIFCSSCCQYKNMMFWEWGHIVDKMKTFNSSTNTVLMNVSHLRLFTSNLYYLQLNMFILFNDYLWWI